jgi:hypothetical protein
MVERLVRQILVTARTYPELSTKHRESACTAGVFLDDRTWCRLYPMPVRYMDVPPKRYDIIEARVWQDEGKDSRPESWRVDPDSIRIVRHVGTGKGRPPDWSERREFVFNQSRLFDSVESLKAMSKTSGISLGMIEPLPGATARIEARPAADAVEWRERLHTVVAQHDLLDEPRPPDLEYLPKRVKVRFKCQRSSCPGHNCVVLDWEICELARREGWESAKRKMDELLAPHYETHFMMGNFNNHRASFGIVGLWYPKRARQGKLF